MSPLDDDAWDAWLPDELGQRLREAIHPWYVAGGWALDLWQGEQTREHEDLEFVVLRKDVTYFRSLLQGLDFFTVKDGTVEYLPPSADVPGDVWQIWGGDMRQGRWRVDMMMEPGTPDLWIYKRDPTIQAARSDAVQMSRTGIPYLVPELVLLYKAMRCREKDQRDFDSSVKILSVAGRRQLRAWLTQLHPNHHWIEHL